jgi:phosphohistidine phosphatase
MEVLIIRHAIAEPKTEEGGSQPDDRLRELTAKGRRRMKRGARGLKAIQPEITLLASSPLIRAVQTAEIVARAYGDIEVTIVPELSPGSSPESVTQWLRKVESAGTVALVGHEPGLTELLVHLLTHRQQHFLGFGKGGAALVELTQGGGSGDAHLVWLATPRLLRQAGR